MFRIEAEGDATQIRQLHESAFETDGEARLVDSIRKADRPRVSLVALLDGEIVGHILFSPVTVAINPEKRAVWGLGPMSVAPSLQRRGIGSELVKEGLEGCRKRGAEVVVVLGHADYYSRFDFLPASPVGLHFKAEAFDPYFMFIELRARAVASLDGFVEYVPEFDSV